MNQFRPSFGVTPPLLAGRDTEIIAFGDALDEGPGAPGRATLYTGVRGIGKDGDAQRGRNPGAAAWLGHGVRDGRARTG